MSKENKGGILKNDQVEKDLQAQGKSVEENQGYSGAQDTGDKGVRQMGNSVQQADGMITDKQNEEN